MTDGDKKQFGELVTGLCFTFDKDPSRQLMQVYWFALNDLSLDEVKGAVEGLIRESKFMPKPAEIREAASGTDKSSLQDKAIAAWSDVERSFGIGSYKWVDFDDSTINATIRHLGGWPEMFERCGTVEGEKWYRLEFLKVYQSLESAGVSEEARRPLPGISEAGRVVLVDGKPMAVEPTPKRIKCSDNRRKEHKRCQPKLIEVRGLIKSAVSGGSSSESQPATSSGESTAISR